MAMAMAASGRCMYSNSTAALPSNMLLEKGIKSNRNAHHDSDQRICTSSSMSWMSAFNPSRMLIPSTLYQVSQLYFDFFVKGCKSMKRPSCRRPSGASSRRPSQLICTPDRSKLLNSTWLCKSTLHVCIPCLILYRYIVC